MVVVEGHLVTINVELSLTIFWRRISAAAQHLSLYYLFFFPFLSWAQPYSSNSFFFVFFFGEIICICVCSVSTKTRCHVSSVSSVLFFLKKKYIRTRVRPIHISTRPLFTVCELQLGKKWKIFFFLNHILIRSSVALRERESLINSLFYLFLKKRSIATAAPHVIVGEYDPIRLFCCCTKKHLTLYYQSASSWSWILKWWWSIRIEISAAAAAAWPRDYIQWIHKG